MSIVRDFQLHCCRPFVALLLLLHSAVLSASAAESPEPDPWVPVGFVIVRSTPDHSEASRFAEHVSSATGFELDLRGLTYQPEHGLSLSKQECEQRQLGPFPCYVARGRFDAGVYVSVERSDAYEGFRPGYFIVVAASGPPGSADLDTTLETVRGASPDAYLRVAEVYHGCIH